MTVRCSAPMHAGTSSKQAETPDVVRARRESRSAFDRRTPTAIIMVAAAH